MLKKELLKLIEKIEDEGSIDEVLSGSDFAKSLLNSGLTLDAFKEKLKADKDFKAFLDSEKDKHSSKSLETWKQNNLEKLLDEEVKKRFPEQDPKDTELAKLKAEIDKMQKESLRKDLTNKAIKIATDKKLPVDLVDFLIGQDEETTTKNLEKLESVFGTHVESLVQERLKGNSYTPPTNTNTNTTTYEDLVKNADNMTSAQVAEMFSKIGK
ncbi:hypothetical protein HMPREF1982_03549 [Clostridiales bacterium oral taxon 876 str. F0540]|nr:hypothetical protein HMPREF1982_03549 [Clostridiales bacterium oral taxon 876 str. F0540]